MITYFILFFLIFITLFFKFGKNKQVSKIFEILIPLCLLFAMMVFRDYSVGNDIVGYKKQFDGYLTKSGFSATKDYGFYIIMYISSKISSSMRFFFAIEYFVFYSGLFLLLYKYSKNVQLSLLFFLFSPLFELSVSGLRQGFGIGICFFAIFFLFKSDKKLNLIISILLWLLSCTMHSCMIPFALIYIVKKIHFSFKNLTIYCLLLVAISISAKYIFYVADFIGDFGYGSSGEFLGFPKVTFVYLSFMILLISYFDGFISSLLVRLNFVNKLQKETIEEIKKMFTVFFAYLVFQSTTTYNFAFPRLGIVFFIPLLFIVPFTMECIKKKSLKILCFAALSIISLVGFIYENYIHDACGVTPFVWGFNL